MLDGVDTYDILGGLKPMLKVVVRFDDGVPLDAQGVALLALEKHLREITGMDCRVYKDLKGDDSKLRVMMSPEMRAKL